MSVRERVIATVMGQPYVDRQELTQQVGMALYNSLSEEEKEVVATDELIASLPLNANGQTTLLGDLINWEHTVNGVPVNKAAADENHFGGQHNGGIIEQDAFDDSHEYPWYGFDPPSPEIGHATFGNVAEKDNPWKDAESKSDAWVLMPEKFHDMFGVFPADLMATPTTPTPKFSATDLHMILHLVTDKIEQVEDSGLTPFIRWTELIVLKSTVHAHLVEIGESVG